MKALKNDLLDKFKGTLFGVAIGDTLGQPFEGWLQERIQKRVKNFPEYFKVNKNKFNTITDDTQLTLHSARALIEGSGFNIDYFIHEYINWLDDPPIGPGYGCLSSIKKLRYGISWKEASSTSGGNGTAMRVSPIGLFYSKDPSGMKKAAYKQSLITHKHPAASAAAIVAAQSVSFLVKLNPTKRLDIEEYFRSLITSISESSDPIWIEFKDILKKIRRSLHLDLESGLIKFSQIGVKSPFFIENYLGKAFVHPYAISTVACAIFIFLKNLESFEKCIFALASAGGDSDTVGAIGGSFAGAYFGFSNIPEIFRNLIKNKKEILTISEELYSKFLERY